MLGKMIQIAHERQKNETGYDCYIKYSTKVRVAEIEADGDSLLITTTPVLENRSVLGDAWTEITFTFKYDITAKKAQKHLYRLGYSEFNDRVSSIDFLKIKTFGNEVCKYFHPKNESDHQAIMRLLDLEDYDDVQKIQRHYYRKVSKYRTRVDDARWLEDAKQWELKEYERDKDTLEKWDTLTKALLDAMPDDSSE
jgi:hypothetical protein